MRGCLVSRYPHFRRRPPHGIILHPPVAEAREMPDEPKTLESKQAAALLGVGLTVFHRLAREQGLTQAGHNRKSGKLWHRWQILKLQAARRKASLVDRRNEPAPGYADVCIGSEIDADVVEFSVALQRFREQKGRRFPLNSEVIAVLRSLGWRKVAVADGEQTA
jgi:hypothetical protein